MDQPANDDQVEALQRQLAVCREDLRAVQLENARLFQAEQQRAHELAIINSIQLGLAKQLEIQAIYDLVGNEIEKTFSAQVVMISTYDGETDTIEHRYAIERGERIYVPGPQPLRGFRQQIVETRRPVLVNTDVVPQATRLGQPVLPGTLPPKSWLGVPLLVGDRVTGILSLQNVDEENAFSEADVRLLETLANSLSVALENARLFAETQRLLKETEQRNAELATINSVQEALASQLDLQAIYELIGEKVREVFNVQVIDIVSYDPAANLIAMPYSYEKGDRSVIVPRAPYGFRQHVINTGEPLLINEKFVELAAQYDNPLLTGDWPQSALFVPLLVAGKVKGVISIQDLDQENAFSPSDVRLLQTLANAMSVAIENARLFAETQRLLLIEQQAHAQAEILRSVAQGLNRSLSLMEVFDLVLIEIQKVIPYDSAGIYQVRGNRREFITGHGFTNLAELIGVSFEFNPIDDEIGYLVAQSLQPLILDDASVTYPQYFNTGPHAAAKICSFMAVPIVLNQEMIGLITLDKGEAGFYQDQHARLSMAFAAQAAIAINNARLFDETQRLLKETEQRAAELAAVNTVSTALVGELDLNALIELVGEQTRFLFKADIAYVALLDEASALINFVYTYGEDLISIKYGEGLTSRIIQTNQPLLINQEMDRQMLEIGATMVGKKSQSYLGVPISVGGKAVGVLSVQSTSQEGMFHEADARLLSTIASNVGIALHNAHLYAEARRARIDAEQANAAKSAFLANMSHELRTPLNAIIGFTRLVRRKGEDVLPAKQLDNLDKVLLSADHLLNLINTVLDIAKIEAGRMDVLAANFRVSALIDLCANTSQPLLRPGVTLEKQVDESLGLVYSDQDKIRQIVLNLLSNAAKFTHEGWIRLSADRDGDNLRIAVADTGIGISVDALPRIFNEFQQADDSTTRQYGGSGLGLSISRNLARLLGGDITVESEVDRGSTFTLIIPMHYRAKTLIPETPRSISTRQAVVVLAETPQATSDSDKKRVLVIDDDPDALYLLQENLNQQEFEISGTCSGADGLRLARERQPQAILLDILMPGMDGWQVLHDLKADPATANIPVVLLTIVDHKALGFRLGAAAYLLKPLDPVAVRHALNHVIGSTVRRPKQVLVVDDDPNVVDMLRQELPEADFKLEAALDGVAGLEAIAANRPDILLLDLIMPQLDGFGVIDRLRVDPRTRDLPIIVLSAKDLGQDEAQRLKETVELVMKKQGFQSEKLVDEINNLLRAEVSHAHPPEERPA